MYGILDINKENKTHDKYNMVCYDDLSSAVAYYSTVNNKYKNLIVLPNLNNSYKVLGYQCHIRIISNLESLNIPINKIINVGIDIDKNDNNILRSAFIKSDDLKLDNYNIIRVNYKETCCTICGDKFKIWGEDTYQGCIYNPLYYDVILLDDLEDYYVLGEQKKLEEKLRLININNPTINNKKIYCLNVNGPFLGLYLSTKECPDNLKTGSIICYNCVNFDDYICIWAH
jgi:hypothetical protein